MQESYRRLNAEVHEKYGVSLETIGAIGFSGMMHGYLPFDKDDRLLAPFRTWRNTMTGQAAEKLTDLLQFSIPQRWSIAHLYQAILNQEPHVKDISHLTTLAGYVHWKLTGQKVMGIGEASGMFPIDSKTNNYDERMMALFDKELAAAGLPCKLQDLLPKVLVAGDPAGVLTAEGARLIDPTGQLQAGIPLCPPEGDAGTGMVATNSVAERTGNVSAGTSVFAMIVLEKALSKVYPEIDMVTTPTGKPVAMVHSNNCTSDLNAWIELFHEVAGVLGVQVSQSRLFETLYQQALEGRSGWRRAAKLRVSLGRAHHPHGGGASALRPHPRKPLHAPELHAHAPVFVARRAEDRHGHPLRARKGQDRPAAGSWRLLQDPGSGPEDDGRGDERPGVGDGDGGRRRGLGDRAARRLHASQDGRRTLGGVSLRARSLPGSRARPSHPMREM